MSIATTANRIQYTGNGVNTTFAFPYKFFANTDLLVYVDDVLKTIATNYSVVGIPPGTFKNGGNVVFTVPSTPPNLSIVTIVRSLAATQATDYQDYSDFPANVFEDDLDRRAMLEQQILDLLGRELTIPTSDPIGLDMTLPSQADRANNFLFFDASGKPIPIAGSTSVPVSTFMATVLDDITAADARTTLDVYSKTETRKRTVLSADTTLVVNSLYKANGTLNLALPASANEGDTIDIYQGSPGATAEGSKITQTDSQHQIGYSHRFMTTKGSSGYLQLREKMRVRLTYHGSGYQYLSKAVRQSDPATLPGAQGNRINCSADGVYWAVTGSGVGSGNLLLYKRTGDSFAKITDPATMPAVTTQGAGFSADGIWLAVVAPSSPYLWIYKRTAGTDTFVKQTDPGTMPTGSCVGAYFSPRCNYLMILADGTTPVFIYKRSGDTFTKLTTTSANFAANPKYAVWTEDEAFLLVSLQTTPFICCLAREGDDFRLLPDPASLPASSGYGIGVTGDQRFVAMIMTSSPYMVVYRFSSGFREKVNNPITIMGGVGGVGQMSHFSADGRAYAQSSQTTPYVGTYKVWKDTFVKQTNPDTIPGVSTGKACADRDLKYFGILQGNTPWINFYKNYEDVTMRWEVETIDTDCFELIEEMFK